MTIETSATVVVVAALVTALATGLGATPFLFVPRLSRSAVGVANALAAGFMIGASGLLFYEGVGADPFADRLRGHCRRPVRRHSFRGSSPLDATLTSSLWRASMPGRRCCWSA